LVLAGCGSSSDNSASATDTGASGEGALTRSEFVDKADALCGASKARQGPLREKVEELARKAREEEQANGSVSDETRRELAQRLGRIVAMAEAGLAQVRALGAPEPDAAQLDAIFQTTESAFESSLAYGDALENHEDAKAQAIAEKGNAETSETAALAKKYGFKVCGSQP
jgi:hypothetical protein